MGTGRSRGFGWFRGGLGRGGPLESRTWARAPNLAEIDATAPSEAFESTFNERATQLLPSTFPLTTEIVGATGMPSLVRGWHPTRSSIQASAGRWDPKLKRWG